MVTKLFQTEQPTKTLFIKCIAFASCISLIIFILFRYVLIVPKVNAEWYNESWKFREAITFTNSGAATTNQKVLVQFDTATPIAASKMQTSCQDVRFTDAQGMLLQYYINLSGGAGVGCNDASSDFYVLMPTIVAGSNLIYIYYGNNAAAAGAVSANFPQSTFSPGAGPTAGSEQVGPGPVAWWHFDEGYDSVAFDSTRFGHNLTLANTAWATSSASFSNRKQYLQFNGATSQASVASSSDLNFGTGSFTISGWFHHPSAIAGTQTIIAKYSTAGWKIYMNSSGYLCFDEDADSTFGGANYDSACSSAIQGSYADSKWHAFEAVKNGTSSITLYVDGIQVAQVTSLSATGSLSSSATLYIGVDTNTNWWNGWLDEMIIYPYARSSAQVLADIEGIHTGTVIGASASDPLTTGLVGYWKMDENTGTSANDTSGNGYTGTWSGSGGSHWVAGKFGSAANYSASDDLITPLDPNPGNLANAFTQRTISAWVTNNNSISGAHIIWEEGGSTNGFALGYRPATSKYVFATSQNGTNVEITSNDTFAINLNWTHVEAVYNAGVMALYVNGILEASGSNGTSIPAHVNAAGIGGVAGADSALTSSVAWTGAIDDVRIYSRAFSPGDVRQLANWAPGPVGWWKMDENTGTAVNDSSGKNNTGVLSGTATPTWTSGKFGSALSFDGSTSYVSAGNDASLQITTAMTLSAWINLKSNASTNDIIARNGASGNYNYRLYTNSTGKLVMEVSTNGTTLVTATGATTLSINTWYYVSGTYQPSTSLTVYVNGVQDGQNTSGIPAQINNTSTVALNIGTENSATSITGAAAFVHECSGSSTSGSIGVTCATTAGNLLVAMIQASTDNTRTFSLSDTGGNTWIECVTCRHQTAGTNNTAELWYSLTTAADTSVTITESGGSTAMISTIEEFSGISGRPLDKSSVGADDTSSTAMTSNATATTSQANEVVAGHLGVENMGTISGAGAGWTYNSFRSGTGEVVKSGYKILSATGAQTNTGTAGTSGRWTATAATFKDTANVMTGFIDDVRIYNYARSSGQIVEDMNSRPSPGGSTGGAIINWKFDEANGATTNNSGFGGSTYNGTISGATWYTGGKVNSAISTATSTNYVSAGDQSFVDGATGLTTGFWVKPISLVTNKALVSKSNFSNQNSFAIVTYATTPSEIRVHIPTSVSDTGTYFTTSGLGLAVDTWSYIDVFYNASASASTMVRVFKNGKEISGTVTGTYPNQLTTGTTSNIKVGASDSGSFTALNAVFDEIKIYPFPLTYDQMLMDYNGGSAMVLGALTTDAGGTASNSAARSYCPPGNTEGNCAVGLDPSPSFNLKFDDNTGTTAIDSSGSNLNSTLQGGASWIPGKIGSALYFNGINAAVFHTDDTRLDPPNDMTWQAWVKLKTLPSTRSEVANIITKNTASLYSYSMSVGTGNHVNIAWVNTTPTTFSATSNSTVSVNTWYFLTAVKSGSNLKIYINGVDDTQVGADSPTGTMTSSNNKLFLGSDNGAASRLDGTLDDARVYPYARTQSQIAWDYNRGGPVAWWKLDECQGNTVYDSSGNVLNGTITIGSTSPQTSTGTCNSGVSTESWNNGTNGKYNASLNLDGQDDYVQINDTPNLDLNLKNFSASFWINPHTITTSVFFLAKMPDTGGSNTSYAFYTTTGNKLEFDLRTNSDSNGIVSSLAVPTGTWTFVTGTWDGSNMKLYINGQLQSDSSGRTLSGTNVKDTANNLTFGVSSNLVAPWYDGKIDDVRIYNYGLTQQQINTVMNQGSTVRFGP